MSKWILSLLAVLLIASPAMAFKDVPANHWAYEAINKAVAAGILQGYNDMFHGKKTLNRYQMAVVVAKMLDQMGKGGTAAPADGEALKQLEALVTEFADELALLNVKVGKLEETVANLGGKPVAAPGPMAAAEGAATVQVGSLRIGGVFKNRYAMYDVDAPAGDYEDFALTNARLLFWNKFTDDLKLFVQTEFVGGTGILDMKMSFRMPNSENVLDFGRFLAPVTNYMYRHIAELDFISYPLYVNGIGISGNAQFTAGLTGGIWRQDGFLFNFNQKGKKGGFKFGIFNGPANNGAAGTTGWPTAVDDDEKAFLLRYDWCPEKGAFSGGLYYWSDEVTGGGTEYDLFGLILKYDKKDKYSFLLEYLSNEWTMGAATAEADDLLFQAILPMTKGKTDFMIRYEDWDFDAPAGAGDTGDYNRITVGFRWKMHENAHIQLDYEMDEAAGGAAPAGDEPKQIIIQSMWWF